LKLNSVQYQTNSNLDSSSYLSNYKTNNNKYTTNKDSETENENIKCEDIEILYTLVKTLKNFAKSKMKIGKLKINFLFETKKLKNFCKNNSRFN
jgi:hypothetical protein